MANNNNRKRPVEQEQKPLVFDATLGDGVLGTIIKRRVAEADGHWNREFSLTAAREENKNMVNSKYLDKLVRDEDYEEVSNHNKIFVSIRTIKPFVTSNMTQPEITPANDKSLSIQFAKDFEKVLIEVADETDARDQYALCIQDVLEGKRVGVGKWVYDPNREKLVFSRLDPTTITIGKRSPLGSEPDFVQHRQKRTIGQLITEFPDKKDAILKRFEIERAVKTQLDIEKDMQENWIFVDTEEGQKLITVFTLDNNFILGKMNDPNWIDGGNNLIKEHMMPFVFFNFLNDGSGWIDNNDFVQMSKHNQKQYDKRGSTIAENAAYAGIGVPVFAKGAIKEETAAQVMFNPKTRILLDQEDVGKSFTTWQGGQLPSFVFEDKQNLEQSVLDVWGTNQVQTASNTDAQRTLGQDVMLRNQAEGRQQELIQRIDASMNRSYKIEAQLIYRYFDKDQFYNILAEDGQFEQLVVSQKKIAKNLGIKISIKSGSNLPVDRSQKIAAAMELAKLNRIGTLRLYKEVGLEDPEEAYREYLREQTNPAGEIINMTDAIYSREADEDLQVVIGGGEPEDREDISPEYIKFLNDYLLTQQFEQLSDAQQERVAEYVANIIAQANRKLIKMMQQQATTLDQTGQTPPVDPNMTPPGSAAPAPAPQANGAPVPQAEPVTAQ
jgi:hypothetical protein